MEDTLQEKSLSFRFDSDAPTLVEGSTIVSNVDHETLSGFRSAIERGQERANFEEPSIIGADLEGFAIQTVAMTKSTATLNTAELFGEVPLPSTKQKEESGRRLGFCYNPLYFGLLVCLVVLLLLTILVTATTVCLTQGACVKGTGASGTNASPEVSSDNASVDEILPNLPSSALTPAPSLSLSSSDPTSPLDAPPTLSPTTISTTMKSPILTASPTTKDTTSVPTMTPAKDTINAPTSRPMRLPTPSNPPPVTTSTQAPTNLPVRLTTADPFASSTNVPTLAPMIAPTQITTATPVQTPPEPNSAPTTMIEDTIGTDQQPPEEVELTCGASIVLQACQLPITISVAAPIDTVLCQACNGGGKLRNRSCQVQQQDSLLVVQSTGGVGTWILYRMVSGSQEKWCGVCVTNGCGSPTCGTQQDAISGLPLRQWGGNQLVCQR